MRRARRAFTCLSVLLLLASAQHAYAGWGWVEKMSGPGPFVGMDLLFPYSLSRLPKQITLEVHNANLDTLELLGVKSVKLPVECVGFLENKEYHSLLRRELGIALPAKRKKEKCDEAEALVADGFLDVFTREITGLRDRDKQAVSAEGELGLEKVLELANGFVLEILTERLRQKTQRFGADPAGVFGGFKMIPAFKDEHGRNTNTFNNRFFTLSLGLAFALENNIRYADGFAGDTDVVWLSVYPAFEQRFKEICGGVNLFFQVGPAVHYFLGAQFDDFLKVSIRGRFGVQLWALYFGGEVDYFLSAIRTDDFGAVPDPTDLDHWSVGGFVAFDLTGGR